MLVRRVERQQPLAVRDEILAGRAACRIVERTKRAVREQAQCRPVLGPAPRQTAGGGRHQGPQQRDATLEQRVEQGIARVAAEDVGHRDHEVVKDVEAVPAVGLCGQQREPALGVVPDVVILDLQIGLQRLASRKDIRPARVELAQRRVRHRAVLAVVVFFKPVVRRVRGWRGGEQALEFDDLGVLGAIDRGIVERGLRIIDHAADQIENVIERRIPFAFDARQPVARTFARPPRSAASTPAA
jgi:hypothetical protein